MLYTADFETTTDINDCRVWAYGICDIEEPERFIHGNNLDDFMAWCAYEGNNRLYFHNLKFDGEFILSWLFSNGFAHVKEDKDMIDKTFTTLISDKGQFFTIKVVFTKKGHHTTYVEFFDSMKILPFSVEKVAKGFNLPIEKLEIDYKLGRPVGHELTADEVKYLQNDCMIMAMALRVLFNQSLDRMTQASNALKDFKSTMPWWTFQKMFPAPDYDADIRMSYRGGFGYANPLYKAKNITGGIVLDVNSLYPSVMRNKILPYGEGIHYDGRYKPHKAYTLYVQVLRCQFVIKPNHIPTIATKSSNAYLPTEYLTNSKGEDVTLTLTSVDLQLFFEHYDVYNIEWIDGWKFKGTIGLFTPYIDKWTKVKIDSKLEGNKAMYTLAKLMLNALYGKFALSPNVRSKYPVMINGVIRYVLGDPETREPLYIPVGTFITSWARDVTIRAAQAVYKRFLYADTDSLHLRGSRVPDGIEISDTELGKWKYEFKFKKARYLRAKAYMEYGRDPGEEKDYWKIVCAGMPARCHPFVKWSNFHIGSAYPGQLKTKHVPGGIVLLDGDFTLKP